MTCLFLSGGLWNLLSLLGGWREYGVGGGASPKSPLGAKHWESWYLQVRPSLELTLTKRSDLAATCIQCLGNMEVQG